ncbi:hypothetical protein D3C81_2198420 [compost metagenome]
MQLKTPPENEVTLILGGVYHVEVILSITEFHMEFCSIRDSKIYDIVMAKECKIIASDCMIVQKKEDL